MSNETLENVVVANKLEKSQGRSPGSRLRKAREARGYTIEEIARKLFLSSQVVQQLENDDFKTHHSITFIRGYLRSYARLVEVDTESLIAEFNALGLADAAPPMSTQRIYRRDSSIISKGLPWVGAIIAVLIGVFVVMWVHSEFSYNQITNPTTTAVNAVAATVTQANNSVSSALASEPKASIPSNLNPDSNATVADSAIANSSDMNTANNATASTDISNDLNAETNSATPSDVSSATNSENTSAVDTKAKSTVVKKRGTAASAKPKMAVPF